MQIIGGNMKKLLAAVIVFCLAFSVIGCNFVKDISDSAGKVKAKTFEFDGISIELTTDFLRMDFLVEDYDFVVGNEDMAIMGTKILKDESGFDDYSLTEYAEYVYGEMEDLDPTGLTDVDGIPTVQYKSVEDGEEQTVVMMFYEGTGCFWVLYFGGDTNEVDAHYNDICTYAKSVKCD